MKTSNLIIKNFKAQNFYIFKNKFLGLCAGLMLTTFATNIYAAPEIYALDPNHTHVLWHINHFKFSNPSGKWMIESGTLILDEAKIQKSKVNVTIDVSKVITGIPELDKHLISKEFFETTKFPTATFISTKTVSTGKKTAKVSGILTLHGVSKLVVLNVKINRLGFSLITGIKTVGFSANTSIKRSDYGIKAYVPGLSDTVKLEIEAEAQLMQNNKESS